MENKAVNYAKLFLRSEIKAIEKTLNEVEGMDNGVRSILLQRQVELKMDLDRFNEIDGLL